MVEGILFGVAALVVLGIVGAKASYRVVTEYERAVFFRLGHVRPDAKGPGVIFKTPFIDRVVKVTLRVEVIDIPPQAVITSDNVTLQVDAVVYFQVTDPVQAILGVDNFRFASQRMATTSLRSIIGRHDLDNLLAHREDVNNELRTVIAASTHHWGVEVRQVELRDIVLPPELLRAMARQAEAERVRRAKVIAAKGELESSAELAQAATNLYQSPGAMQLRQLQTLAEVATEHNSTLVFPIPIEIMAGFMKAAGSSSVSDLAPFSVAPGGAGGSVGNGDERPAVAAAGPRADAPPGGPPFGPPEGPPVGPPGGPPIEPDEATA